MDSLHKLKSPTAKKIFKLGVYFVLLIMVLSALVNIAGNLIYKTPKRNSKVESLGKKNNSEATSPSPSFEKDYPDYILTEPIHAPYEDLVLSQYYKLEGEEYKLTVSIYSNESGGRLIEDLPISKESGYLKSYNKEERWVARSPVEIEIKKHAIWNPMRHEIALLLPDKLLIIPFEYQPEKIYPDTFKTGETVEFKNEVYVGDEHGLSSDYFFYSGDGNEIYLLVTDGYGESKLQTFDLVNKTAEVKDAETNTGGIYPVANSPGYVRWSGTSVDTDFRQNMPVFPASIVHVTGSNEQKYDLPDIVTSEGYVSFDYGGPILFSPNKDYICLERGASGGWGYTIFKINGSNLEYIKSGPQYSYCIKWTENYEIITNEKRYHPGGSYYYKTNVINKEYELIHQLYESEVLY